MSLTEQIEAVRAAFEASDKGLEALDKAWTEVGRIVPQGDPDDESVALPLLRFVKRDLVLAKDWPASAYTALGALYPLAKRWQHFLDADFGVERAEVLRRKAIETGCWNSRAGNRERQIRAAEEHVRYARRNLECAQKDLKRAEKHLQDLRNV